jgi:hypothetical protein
MKAANVFKVGDGFDGLQALKKYNVYVGKLRRAYSVKTL